VTIKINHTDHDHIPEEFTIEGLKESGLTDQEIDALTEGDDPIVTRPDPEADDDATAAALEVGKAPKADEAAAQAAPKQEAAPPDPKLPEIPDTSAAEERVGKIDEELSSLSEKYDEGELSTAEFVELQRKLILEQTKAQLYIEQAGQVMQQAARTAQQHWNDRLEAYKAEAPDLWAESNVGDWDRHLRSVTGNSHYADMPRDAQIRLAHQNMAAEYELRHGEPFPIAPKAKGKGPASKTGLTTSQEKRPDPISTLHGYNSDTSAEVEDSTFAAIDRASAKDPLAGEEAFMRLTPEQQERFLNEV
jgi:hypothetical protein